MQISNYHRRNFAKTPQLHLATLAFLAVFSFTSFALAAAPGADPQANKKPIISTTPT